MHACYFCYSDSNKEDDMPEMSEYERKREERIKENKRKLEEIMKVSL